MCWEHPFGVDLGIKVWFGVGVCVEVGSVSGLGFWVWCRVQRQGTAWRLGSASGSGLVSRFVVLGDDMLLVV